MTSKANPVKPHKHKLVLWKRGFPLRLCKCGLVSGINPKIGSNTIDIGAAGAGDIIRWSGSAAAIDAGDIGMSALSSESSSGRMRAFIENESRDIAEQRNSRGGGLNRMVRIQQNGGLSTLSTQGTTAPTTEGTASNHNVGAGHGQFINYASPATIDEDAGLATTFDLTRRNFRPVIDIAMRTGGDITSVRIWSGLFSGDPMDSDTPLLHYAGFRYAPAVDGTAFWRCLTDDGSGSPTVTVTTQSIAINTSYRLRIVFDQTLDQIRFYINGAIVATHTTTLPGVDQNIGFSHKVRTLVASARSIRFGRMILIQRAA